MWAAVIAEHAHADRIDVVSTFDVHEEVIPNTEWAEFAENERQEWLEKSELANGTFELSYELLRGSGLKALLGKMVTGEYDLVILQKGSNGSHFEERVVRESTSGVLIVPEGSKPDLSHIMLAVDFSDISKLAIEWAESFASLADGEVELKALHIMQMPSSSKARALINEQELRERIESISKDKLNDFLQENAELAEKWIQFVAEHPLPFAKILEESSGAESGLLVVGSHGLNAISSALLGGQSIELIRSAKCPLLMVKRKNERLGFIKRLLGFSK
jgi:nucleotide-binding universal stress UspA family protein